MKLVGQRCRQLRVGGRRHSVAKVEGSGIYIVVTSRRNRVHETTVDRLVRNLQIARYKACLVDFVTMELYLVL